MPKKINSESKENFLKLFVGSHYSIRRTCKEINIGKSTFYRWLQDPEFNREVKKIRKKRKDSFAEAKRILANARSLRKTIRFLSKYG
jgi:transposase